MNSKFSLTYSLEWVSAIAACGAALTLIYTFVVGQHYIIPTVSLVNTILFGHLAYYGMQKRPWARAVLFWIATIISAHAFFALFWAKTPREILDNAFIPTYVCVFVLFAFLAWVYRNEATVRRSD